jgi:hypothetical protein
MEISSTDRVRNEVLQNAKEERNILQTVKRGKTNWMRHILQRNCLLKHVTEGKMEGMIEVTGRRGRRRKQLLDDFLGTVRVLEIERGRTNLLPLEEATGLS